MGHKQLHKQDTLIKNIPFDLRTTVCHFQNCSLSKNRLICGAVALICLVHGTALADTDSHLQTVNNIALNYSAKGLTTYSILLGGIIAYLLGGLVKGIAGIGMALIAVPTMAMIIDPKIAVALVAFPLVFTNIWQALRQRTVHETIQSYWRLSLSMTLVMYATALLARDSTPMLVTLSLGTVAIVFALINLGMTIPTLPDKHDRPAQWAAGTLAGLIGGVSGLVVIPLVAYMIMRRVDKNKFVCVLGFLLFVSGIVLASTQWQTGVFTDGLAIYSLLLVIPGMLGVLVGEKIRNLINTETFKKFVLVLILLIGGNLVVRSFVG